MSRHRKHLAQKSYPKKAGMLVLHTTQKQYVLAFRHVFARRLLAFCAQLKPSGTNTSRSDSDRFKWYQTLWFSNFLGKVLDALAKVSALAGAFPQRTCTPSLSPFLSSPSSSTQQRKSAGRACKQAMRSP